LSGWPAVFIFTTLLSAKKIRLLHKTGKIIASCFLITLLVLLTGMNFLVYGLNDSRAGVAISWMDEEAPDTNPSGPDEKGPGNPVSFNEEYLHDAGNIAGPGCSRLLVKFAQDQASRLLHVHFEIVSPPPDLSLS
jgi:hypothetical protein